MRTEEGSAFRPNGATSRKGPPGASAPKSAHSEMAPMSSEGGIGMFVGFVRFQKRMGRRSLPEQQDAAFGRNDSLIGLVCGGSGRA